MDGSSSIPNLSFEFFVLAAACSEEARLAKWEEMELKTSVWIVLTGRMRVSEEHKVPLSGRAAAVLQRVRNLNQSQGEKRRIMG